MKNNTRCYGRNFCEDVEMKCIVTCAPIGRAEYKATDCLHKLFLTNLPPITEEPADRVDESRRIVAFPIVYWLPAFTRRLSLGACRARILRFRTRNPREDK